MNFRPQVKAFFMPTISDSITNYRESISNLVMESMNDVGAIIDHA
jgi:hypothetical protein